MLYCPHGSVRCPYESMGEIRLLEMPVEIHLSIHCLSGQSVSEKPSLWLCLEICISVISVFVRWNFFLHQGVESWPSWCSDGAAAAALWTPTVALHAGSEQGASRQCTCLCANCPSGARARKPGTEHISAQGDAWPSPVPHQLLLTTTLLLYWANK